MFHGPISQSLVNLNQLTSLQLQGNDLTGQIPEFNQQELVSFNVSNNNLSGPIPQMTDPSSPVLWVVKRPRDLKPMTREEFKRQMTFLASQRHPNLLPPYAYYYYSRDEKLLVYQFFEKGTIFDRIHGESRTCS